MRIEEAPTLSQVNEKLLSRLFELIDSADSEEILRITESVAKLNSSYKGNDQFGQPLSDDERAERENQEVLTGILTGEVVDG